jgi:hypothetical protein
LVEQILKLGVGVIVLLGGSFVLVYFDYSTLVFISVTLFWQNKKSMMFPLASNIQDEHKFGPLMEK